MQSKGVAVFGNVAIDFDRMELRRCRTTIYATVLEFKLLKFFVDHPEYVFSRQQLLGAVWPDRKHKSERTVDNAISHLRRKLEEDPPCPIYFQTVHGVGYKFVPFGRMTNDLGAGVRGEFTWPGMRFHYLSV